MVQQFFAVVNPLLSLLLAGAFSVLAHRWPAQRHLAVLSFAFLLSTIAFCATSFDFGLGAEHARYLGNICFFGAVMAACASTVMRAGFVLPTRSLSFISILTLAGFSWFEFVVPSTLGRIYAISLGFGSLALLTLYHLRRKTNWLLADHMISAAVVVGLALAVVRPLLVQLQLLDIGAEGRFLQSPYWATVIAFSPLLSVFIGLVFVAAIALDIYEHVKIEADHDYLTGLLNRRGFEAAVQRQLVSASKPAVLMADIDDFKRVNDTYGHQAGDNVIKYVASVLKTRGCTPVAARVGGEEFVLFYNEVELSSLREIADDIRLALTEPATWGLPHGETVTLSIGLHTRDGSENFDSMLSRADQALYRAKRAGKDRAEHSAIPLKAVMVQARA